MAGSAGENGHERTLTSAGNYGASQLYLTITKDENWSSGKSGTTEEYKDKEDHVVLKRVWESESVSLSTYYVYDDLGNLSFVLPPKAAPDAGVPAATVREDLCYQYRYDGRRRLIEKKVPGKGWEYMVYNILDQLILSQDAVQRASNKWHFVKYNALGAEVMRGYYTIAGTRAAVQTAADNHATKWESYVGSTPNNKEGYDNQSYPTTNLHVMRVNYYDDYSFPENPFGGQQGSQSHMTKGLMTGTKVRSGENGALLRTALYYDTKGQVIQSKSENHLGGTDVTNSSYSFTGELTTSSRVHTSPGKSVTIATRNEYDHMNRKTRLWQKINNENEVLLSSLSYNDVGQLKEKSLHNNMKAITYAYNERGWIKSMTAGTTFFDQYLRYNDPQKGAAAQWNGNISEQEYTSTHTGNRWFTYSYDKLNRLKTAVYSNGNELGEELTYDQMGNITKLIRGGAGNGTLNYVYTGNRLTSVSGFKVGSYVHNANGNMTTDGVRGVTIGYNALNLPISVSGTAGTAIYLYDADGNKQRSVQESITRDYIAGIQYENGQISQLMTEEGRVVRNASNDTYRYEYYLKDHLGNTRVVIDDQGNHVARVVQSDEYYAFGLNKSRYVSGDRNIYLYNGKEKQDVLTEQYDYGARFYDPVIGRFTTIDPQAEAEEQDSWTPYHYGFNNPIKHIDPDGEFPILSNIVGGLVAAGVEYGSQVTANVYENGFTSKAFTENIDGGDILIAAGEGFLTSGGSVVKNAVLKGGIKVAAEVARNAVDVKNGKVTTNSIKSTAVNTALGLVAGKVSDKAPGTKMKVANAPTPKEAVKAARANGPVNRSKRIATETAAKAKQKTAKEINSTVNKGAGGVVVGGASEEAKRKIDKKIN